MKKILCIALVLVMLFSLSSCVIKQKYDYKDMGKYVTIPTVDGKEITVDLDMIQMTIDQDLASLATDKVLALEGQDVEIVITFQEYKILGTDESGNNVDQKGDIWYSSDNADTTDKKETIAIKNLGAGNFISTIETRLLKCKLGESTTENDYIIPTVEELANLQANYPEIYAKLAPHAGKRVYLSYSFASRAVKEGDVVSVTYTGYEMDENGNILVKDGKDVTFEGGSGTSKVYIGSRTFIKDFEIGLIGATVNKEVKFKATFPEDYGEKDTEAAKLNGKTVIFKATVTAIYDAPEYNLEYIKENYGDKYESVEDFEKALIDSYASSQIVEVLVSGANVLQYPKKEYKLIKQQLNDAAASIVTQYNMTLEQYIKQAYGFESVDAYIYSVMKAEMAYYKYAQDNDLVVTDADIAKAKQDLIEAYKAQYLSSSSKITEDEALSYATEYVETGISHADLYQEALYVIVGDHLKTKYKVIEKPATYTSVTKGGSLFDPEPEK